MKTDTTYVWGVAADDAGIIQHTSYHSKTLSRGGVRAWKTVELDHEPATAYAASHPAPMPMRWGHRDEIGRVLALRRNHGRLYAVAESTLEPDELEYLTEEYGELRWSTSTDNLANEPLRITEISLTPSPATVGLRPVKWYRLGVTKGNMPAWVKEDLKRAEKTEFRFQHRGELKVHDLDYERNGFQRDVGLHPSGGELEGRHVTINGEGFRLNIDRRAQSSQ